jgi:hypothetical protein
MSSRLATRCRNVTTAVVAPTSTFPSPDLRAGASPGGLLPGLLRRYPLLIVLGILLLGVGVYLPSLRSEFLLDDYLHASMIDGTFPVHRGPLDIYDFVSDGERPILVARGMLPWWAHPQLRIRFLRPLPSFLRWAEQHAFGHATLGPHLHSFLWWIAVVLVGRRLFRRLLPPRPALLATIIFALAPCHALPIAWLANREALISLTLGALALTSYLRWREEGGVLHAVVAAGLFAVSMVGGEYALGFGAYVLAFELLAWGEPLWRRGVGLLLFGVPAAGYLAVWAALHYGTAGSSFYVDPIHQPLPFLSIAPRRLATLLVQEWMTIDSDDTASPWMFAAFVVVGFILVAVPIRRVLAAQEPRVRGRAQALLLGSHLALLPVLAADPSPRVLGAAMLGLVPTFALVLDHAWFPAPQPERRGAAELTGLVALGIGFAQLVHGPVTSWMIGEKYRRTSVDFLAAIREMQDRIGDPEKLELFAVRGGQSAFFLPFALAREGKMPGRWRVLSTTGHTLGLRTGPRTLELIVPKDQRMVSRDVFRSVDAVLQPGEVIDTPGLRATILEVGTEGPRRVRFEMDRDLDDPDNSWFEESGRGTFPAAPPPQPGFGRPYDP